MNACDAAGSRTETAASVAATRSKDAHGTSRVQLPWLRVDASNDVRRRRRRAGPRGPCASASCVGDAERDVLTQRAMDSTLRDVSGRLPVPQTSRYLPALL